MWLGLASQATRPMDAAGKVRPMRLLDAVAAAMCLACSVPPYEVKGTALDPTAPSSLASPSSTLVPRPGTPAGIHGSGTPDGGLP